MKTANINGFRIAARGLVVENRQLLLVSNDDEYWYLPGGHLEPGESLPACVEREIYEETGLEVRTGRLIHVLECKEVRANVHRVHFYFQTERIGGELSPEWTDQGGVVRYHRFFSLKEIQANDRIVPHFLRLGTWLAEASQSEIYQGLVHMQGFEVIDS